MFVVDKQAVDTEGQVPELLQELLVLAAFARAVAKPFNPAR
jgi:hypothetical protein